MNHNLNNNIDVLEMNEIDCPVICHDKSCQNNELKFYHVREKRNLEDT